MSESIERTAVNGIRTALGIGGILAVILGILILVWPVRTLSVLTGIVAIYAIAAGLLYVGLAIFSKGRGGWTRVGNAVLGALLIVAGILTLFNLQAVTEWFAVFAGILIGILWIIEGTVSLATLRTSRAKGWTVFFAILSIIAGIVLLFSPLWGTIVLWWLLGIGAIVLGIVQIIRAFTFAK